MGMVIFIHFVHFCSLFSIAFSLPSFFLSPLPFLSSSQVAEWAEGKEHNIHACCFIADSCKANIIVVENDDRLQKILYCTLDNTILIISSTNVLVGMVIFIIACVHFCFLLSIAFSLPSFFLPLFLLPFFPPLR